MASKKQILVVDDDNHVREILRLFLERHGYRISEAPNGYEAVEACMKAIAQPASKKIAKKLQDNIFAYISIASILAFGVGIVYYQFKKIRLKRVVTEESQLN